MSRVAVAVLLVVPMSAPANDPPRDATKPLRTVFHYGGLEVPGIPKPEPVPELPLRLPEKIAGESRFHVPAGTHAAALSPDGKTLVCAGGNTWGYPLWLFDAATGKEIARFYGHTAGVNQIRFSPDSKLLFTGGKPVGTAASPDGTLRVWDMPAKTEIDTAPARCWAITPDAKFLLTTEDRHAPPPPGVEYDLLLRTRPVAVVRTVKDWAVHREFEPDFRIESADVSPDGKRVALGGPDGKVRLFEVKSGKPLRTLAGLNDKDVVANVAFSPDGKHVAAGAVAVYAGSEALQPVLVWDVETGTVAHRLGADADPEGGRQEKVPLDACRGGVIALQYTPDGKHLVTADRRGTVICWDLNAGRIAAARQLLGQRTLHIAPDGKRVFLGNHGVRPGVFTLPELGEKPLVPDPAKPELGFETAGPLPKEEWKKTAELPDGSRLRTGEVSSDGGGVEHTGGKEKRVFDKPRIVAWDVTADGKTLATFGHKPDGQGFDHPLKIWDVATGKETAAWRLVPRPEYTFRFNPAGTRLAVLHSDGYVRVWDVKTGKAVLALDPDWHWPNRLTWSKDGTKLVACGADAPVLVVWDATEPK